jgi:hypothetical protein
MTLTGLSPKRNGANKSKNFFGSLAAAFGRLSMIGTGPYDLNHSSDKPSTIVRLKAGQLSEPSANPSGYFADFEDPRPFPLDLGEPKDPEPDLVKPGELPPDFVDFKLSSNISFHSMANC